MSHEIEKPPVNVTASGVHFVKSADIFRSRAGQEAIRAIAAMETSKESKASR